MRYPPLRRPRRGTPHVVRQAVALTSSACWSCSRISPCPCPACRRRPCLHQPPLPSPRLLQPSTVLPCTAVHPEGLQRDMSGPTMLSPSASTCFAPTRRGSAGLTPCYPAGTPRNPRPKDCALRPCRPRCCQRAASTLFCFLSANVPSPPSLAQPTTPAAPLTSRLRPYHWPTPAPRPHPPDRQPGPTSPVPPPQLLLSGASPCSLRRWRHRVRHQRRHRPGSHRPCHVWATGLTFYDNTSYR